MGFFGTSTKVSKVDTALIQQLAQIELMVEDQSDFMGVFGSEDRNALEMLCSQNESSFPSLNLALIHIYGINVETDFDKGEKLLLQSIELGNPFAFKYMALIEEEIKLDLNKGISYLKKGCDAGDAAAMTNLAVFYMQGRGVTLDRNKAIKMWKKAAKLGNKEAAINLQREGE